MTFQNDAVMVLAEVISCKLFYETFAVKKAERPFYTSYVVPAWLVLIIYGLSDWLAGHFVLREYIIVMATGLLMMIYLELTVGRALVLAFLFRCLILAVDYGGISFVLYFLADYQALIKLYLIVANIFCKLFSFFIIFAVNRIFKKHNGDILQIQDRLKFALFPIFSIIMLAAVIAAYQYVERPQQAQILVVIAIGQLGMNIFVYYMLENLLKRERKIREEKLFITEISSQVNMYQTVSDNYEKQRKRVHEFKNQILCIEGLLEQEKYDKAKEYVKGISGRLGVETNAIHTNHAIIDAVLNTKYNEAEDKQIVFVVKVSDLSSIQIEDEDIVVILSNLLDNAIEAAEKCVKNRVIWLKFVKEDGIILSVKNTYAEKPEMVDGKFITSKSEKESHGIGMENIAQTVKKYKGSYVVKDGDGELLVSILLPEA